MHLTTSVPEKLDCQNLTFKDENALGFLNSPDEMTGFVEFPNLLKIDLGRSRVGRSKRAPAVNTGNFPQVLQVDDYPIRVALAKNEIPRLLYRVDKVFRKEPASEDANP
jgi:hypothetical protein